MKIVLVGYMGSGKSTVGKVLAEKLNVDFFDLDDIIEKENKLSVSDIFKTKGELFFRKQENQLLTNVLNKNSFVLSVGGGTPMYFNNMKLIIQNSISIYLRSDLSTLTERLFKEKENRPLISHLKTKESMKEFIAKHIFERKVQYENAKYVVDISNKIVDVIKDEILKLLH